MDYRYTFCPDWCYLTMFSSVIVYARMVRRIPANGIKRSRIFNAIFLDFISRALQVRGDTLA